MHRTITILLVAVAAAIMAASCGTDVAVRSASPAPDDDTARSEDAEHDDGAPPANGLVLAGTIAATPDSQVAIWSGAGPANVGAASELQIDPPLGREPRTSRDGAVLAWLDQPGGAGGPVQPWLLTDGIGAQAQIVAITNEGTSLPIRALDVSGDGGRLVVAAEGVATGDGAAPGDSLWAIDVASGAAEPISVPGDDALVFDDVAVNDDGTLVAVEFHEEQCGGEDSADPCNAGLAMLETRGAGDEPGEVEIVYSAPRAELRSPVFTHDGEHLMYVHAEMPGGTEGDSIRSVPSDQLLEQYDDIEPITHAVGLADVQGIAISPDGAMLVASTRTKGMRGELVAHRLQPFEGEAGTAPDPAQPIARTAGALLGTPIWVPADPRAPASGWEGG